MGQAISTSSLWGAHTLMDSASRLESFENIIDAAFIPGGLGPMLMSPDLARCLDALCADSNRFFQRRFGCTPRDWTRLALTA